MQAEEDGTAKVVGPHRRKKHSVLQTPPIKPRRSLVQGTMRLNTALPLVAAVRGPAQHCISCLS